MPQKNSETRFNGNPYEHVKHMYNWLSNRHKNGFTHMPDGRTNAEYFEGCFGLSTEEFRDVMREQDA